METRRWCMLGLSEMWCNGKTNAKPPWLTEFRVSLVGRHSCHSNIIDIKHTSLNPRWIFWQSWSNSRFRSSVSPIYLIHLMGEIEALTIFRMALCLDKYHLHLNLAVVTGHHALQFWLNPYGSMTQSRVGMAWWWGIKLKGQLRHHVLAGKSDYTY